LRHINDFIAGESDALQAGASVNALAIAIATLIVALFFGQLEAIPVIVPLILVAAVEAFNLGQAAWDAYFTSDVEDDILCALYCNIGEDGLFTQAQMDAFIAQLRATAPAGVALDVLTNELVAGGLIALNNMVSYGSSSEADCSACNCACDLTNWTVRYGVEISRTSTEIVVQSTNEDGTWTAELQAPTISNGCIFGSVTFDGEGSLVYQWNERPEAVCCPMPFPLNHGGAGLSTTCVNDVRVFGFSNANIGVVTFTVSGECP